MTYDVVARLSQVSALLFFMALFAGVVAYAFWPGSRRRFDDIQKTALDLDTDQGTNGGRR